MSGLAKSFLEYRVTLANMAGAYRPAGHQALVLDFQTSGED